MSDLNRRVYAKFADTSARRLYLRDFSDMPAELLGSKMEKERYLNALAEKTLYINGVQPHHG